MFVRDSLGRKPKPIYEDYCGRDQLVAYECPKCKGYLLYKNSYDDNGELWDYQQNYCDGCGQKLDWSEVE